MKTLRSRESCMAKFLVFLTCLFMSVSLYAKDLDYIGTRSNPIPLKSSGPIKVLESITIYLYQDKSFDITDKNVVLFSGTYIDGGDSVTFSDHIAFSNKIYTSKGEDKMTCLQTVLYKPDIYKYKSDWFCP